MNDQTTAIKALVKAQAAMPRAIKDSTNPHFKSKYADLTSVQKACLPSLHTNGFAVVHSMGEGEGSYVETLLLHESGASWACRVPLRVDKDNMQGLGSAITYARRYGLMCLSGVAPDDDDGNAAAAAPPKDLGAGAGVKEAWIDGIKDSLPPDYSAQDFASACAKQILADMKKAKTAKGTLSAWDKRGDLIDWIAEKFPAIHQNLLDEYSAIMRGYEEEAEAREAAASDHAETDRRVRLGGPEEQNE